MYRLMAAHFRLLLEANFWNTWIDSDCRAYLISCGPFVQSKSTDQRRDQPVLTRNATVNVRVLGVFS